MLTSRHAVFALFVVTALGAPLWSQTKEKPLAVVNGEVITRADFENIWKRLPPPPKELKEDQIRALQLELLNLMVDETLFQQFLRKNVPQPDRSVIDQRIAELDKSLKAKGRTMAEYLKDSGQTEARLRQDLAAVVQWNAYLKKNVSEADLQKQFEQNRELFEGALIRVSHIMVNATRGDLKAQQAAMQKLQKVRQELAGGLDFAEAAKKYSEDSNAPNGGDLGYFPPSRSDREPFVKAASALKVGEISPVVQTDYGFHLIKVTDRKPGKPVTLEEVKDEARMLSGEELRAKIIADERKAAKLEVNLP